MTNLCHFAAVVLLGSYASAATPADCWAMRKHGKDSDAQQCFTQLARSNQEAIRAEGFWGLQEWDRANEQFRLATQSANNPAGIKARWGFLLHERFNNKDAADLFREALTQDPTNADAYIGLAIISSESFDGKAMFYTNKAMEISPKRAQVHELAASLALEHDDRDMAAAEADKALELDSNAMDAMSVRAALELIDQRSPDSWISRIQAINPHYGLAYTHIAHQLEMHYRQADAATYYRQAIAADPALWSAHADLGIALMRIGQQDEAKKELELSYNNGYRDAVTVNSLRLLDSYSNYVTLRDDATILILKKTEADLMGPYLKDELHQIINAYNTKYAMKLTGPIQLEVYPDHEDFAVRTMGMPGLGALGATFGKVIAMDSPSARKPGEFNWGATLWHEMSHAYVLAATNNRVPRWFTEGLAVHEEGEHSSEWANRATPDVLMAIRENKLLPVLSLDRGFVYPEYPAQIVVSYFQAGSICDFIKERWGERKLLDMVHSYGALQPTQAVILHDLGLSAEQFDEQYRGWIDKKYSAQTTHFDEWQQKLKVVATAARDKQWDLVLKEGNSGIALYPQYVGQASLYEFLADAYRTKGDKKGETEILDEYKHAGGEDPAILKRLATLQEQSGDHIHAIETLSKINYIYPVNDADLHRRLGDLLYEKKSYSQSAREYSAAIASHPVDQAGLEYLLAKTLLAGGRRSEAEESILAALEIAPGYVPAQKLLLELHQTPAR